jgi:hypothetical protein
MEPIRDIEEAIRKKLHVRAGSALHDRVLARVRQAQEQYDHPMPAPTERAIRRMIFRNPRAKLAAAAVIIVAIGSFIVQRDWRKQERPRTATAAKSPAEMMTTMSLRIAHRRGGMEAVEQQYSEAFKRLGRRPGSLSVEQILAEFDGT